MTKNKTSKTSAIPQRTLNYWKFEEELPHATYEELLFLLDKFRRPDFLKAPIIFDLIVERKWELLDYLYKKKVPFGYTDSAGGNALHVAAAKPGCLSAVRFLIEKNILTDINAKTDENETPFLLAIMYEHEDIVEYFLKHFKPDLSISTIYGDTAFTLAKKAGNKKILAMLDKYNSSKKVRALIY